MNLSNTKAIQTVNVNYCKTGKVNIFILYLFHNILIKKFRTLKL